MKALTSVKRVQKLLAMSVLTISLGLFSTSCGESKHNLQIEGLDGPHLTLIEDNLLISMVFENLYVQGGLRYNIPKYENSYVEVSPDLQSGGTLMAVSVSLQDVFNGNLEDLEEHTLPGGRPLPGVIGGRLPAVAFSIPQWHHMGIYLGPRVFGIFVPLKMSMEGSILTSRFYSNGKRTGNLSIIGKDVDGENSGILLMLDLGAKTKKYLKKIANKHD